MKKVTVLFLSVILFCSLMTAEANGAVPREPNPAPAPAVLLGPVDPEGPQNPKPPMEPQDDKKDTPELITPD